MSRLVYLGRNLYVLRTASGDVGVQFTKVTDQGFGSGTGGSKSEFVPRGAKDDALSRMHKLITESPNKLRLVKTRRDFVIGKGLCTRRVEVDPEGNVLGEKEVVYPDFADFRKRLRFDKTISQAAIQQAFNNDVFVKLTLGLNRKVEAVEVLDCFHVRIKRLQPGETRISTYLFNACFGTKAFKKDQTIAFPAFDPTEPTKHGVSIIHLRDPFPGQFYYQMADWWGTEGWTEVANQIPKFHLSGLRNGYNLKYHITIPDNYFEKEGLTLEQQEALKIATLNQMGESLSGVENVDKVIYTFNPIGPDGKPIDGVKIISLKNEMSDDAYTKLFTTANVAQASGHGVLPVLAGIDTGGKLGGSGKELEAAANYMQGFLTMTDRTVLLELLEHLRAIEGWDETIEFFFKDVTLYTYDVTPAAAAQNPNNKPAGDSSADDPNQDNPDDNQNDNGNTDNAN